MTTYLDRAGREISEDEAFDERGALKDGCGMRVPMQFRDAIRDADMRKRIPVRDAWGRPTGAFLPDDYVVARQRVEDARAEMMAEQRDAWRTSKRDPLAAPVPPVSPSVVPRTDARPTYDAAKAAYEQMCRDMA